MINKQYFKDRIFKIQSDSEFEKLSLELFRFQARHNSHYGQYLDFLNVDIDQVKTIDDIPFLPVSSFKNADVMTGKFQPTVTFSSSGTGGGNTSRHHLEDIDIYVQSFREGFTHFYGAIDQWCILALLPSYLEREGSSLIYMVNDLIGLSSDKDSNFYLDQYEELFRTLERKKTENKKTLLLGVSFALIDFAENHFIDFSELSVMETGGMKGRRKEMIREELHQILRTSFKPNPIHSEYGMTELLSQAYSQGEGRFHCPLWMKVRIRETDDPFSPAKMGKTGGVNIIDLANIDSCAFIETQDLGRIYPDNSFEIMGRFDNSDIRGCNLMVI